jgi:hypothetical protein
MAVEMETMAAWQDASKKTERTQDPQKSCTLFGRARARGSQAGGTKLTHTALWSHIFRMWLIMDTGHVRTAGQSGSGWADRDTWRI